MNDLVFLDTETTGLGPDDEIWEFAAVRRFDQDDAEAVLHIQIEHDGGKAAELPEKFYADYNSRYNPAVAMPAGVAAEKIRHFLLPVVTRDLATGERHVRKTHIVGANPAFDAGKLAALFARFDLVPTWHYHLIDLEATTVGYLLALGLHVPIPWRSDDLAARVGAPTTDPDGYALYDRHTAMGDVEWCRDWWDAMNGVAQ